MSQENVEAFKRGLEAGNRGDVDGLLDELHPEIEWQSDVVLPRRGESPWGAFDARPSSKSPVGPRWF